MRQVCAVFLGVMACGSAGDPEDADPGFDAFTQQVMGVGVTPLGETPDHGTHRYQGAMRLSLPLPDAPRDAYLGTLELTIAPQVSAIDVQGTASAFEGAGGASLSGSLAISGGVLLPDPDPARDFLWIADLDGTLQGSGRDLTLTARLFGDFYGMDADGVAGRVAGGLIETPDWDDNFDGDFAAEKTP